MYSSNDHPIIGLCAWRPEEGAIWVTDHILMSRGTTNAYLVASDDGDVVINAGFAFQGMRHRARYEEALQRPLQVEKIVFTDSHPEHIGGWQAFADDSAETIVQEGFADGRLDRTQLHGFYPPRSRRIVGNLVPQTQHERWFGDSPYPSIGRTFDKFLAFEVGGRLFELHSTPGNETLDTLIVSLPDERTVFCSNLMGAIFGAVPHLYTPRGDRIRSARLVVRSIDKLLSLEPELLITGHGEPITGWATVRERVEKVRDAVQYIQDETIKGMNEGKSLFELMDQIELPDHLRPSHGRGPVRWYVRAVWEEYAGWFRMESTTELYEVPQRAIWSELVELIGADELVARARTHLEGGRPVEALHFLDIVLESDPHHRAARMTQRDTLLNLLDQTAGRAYDEMTWLESELAMVTSTLAE
jgi:alkyl sulfatase BDS1-like metallo-beta-lactamase superfamily hydrolase